MDSVHFDSLVRSLLSSGTRRGALAAVLGGALGVTGPVYAQAKKTKKKKKKQKCGCPGGRVRLLNGTCSGICASSEECPANCDCFTLPSLEGSRHCVPPDSECETVPQICGSTAQCPFGQFCVPTGCSGNPNRCVPLCG